MPKQRRSESGKEAAKAVEWTAQRRSERKWKTRVNRKKHLQRLKPAEDERKLQTKLFVEQCVEAERRKPPLDESG